MKTPPLTPVPALKVEAHRGDPDFNPPSPSEVANENCPRCQKKLIDPNGLGWCKACGYCKSLEEDKARVPLEVKPVERKPSTLGIAEFCQLLIKLPSWVWTMFGGACVVVAFNVPLSQSLPSDCLPRAVISTGEFILGLLMIFAGQIWALCYLAPNDDKLHFKDAVVPGQLWVLTLKKLPQTRGQVWIVAWGLTCILSSIFVIGGMTHWLNYLPKKTPPPAIEQSE